MLMNLKSSTFAGLVQVLVKWRTEERLIQTVNQAAALEMLSLRDTYEPKVINICRTRPSVGQVTNRLRRFAALSRTRDQTLYVKWPTEGYLKVGHRPIRRRRCCDKKRWDRQVTNPRIK